MLALRQKGAEHEVLQDLGVTKESTGDGETLTLTTRKKGAFSSDSCVESVW